MEIVPDLTKSNLSKNQVEYIQKKQHEYKLTDKKRRVPGHILFSFNLKTKEILPFMEEEIMRKLRTYNVYSTKEYEDIRKAVRYSIRFCKKHKIVRCEDKDLNK